MAELIPTTIVTSTVAGFIITITTVSLSSTPPPNFSTIPFSSALTTVQPLVSAGTGQEVSVSSTPRSRIIVGVIAGVVGPIVILCLVALCLRRRMRQRAETDLLRISKVEHSPSIAEEEGFPKLAVSKEQAQNGPLAQTIKEMDGLTGRAELPSRKLFKN